MPNSALFPWSEELLEFNFGAGHPMTPIRLMLTHELAGELGVLDLLRLEPVRGATTEELLRVHEAGYVAAVEGADRNTVNPEYGLGEPDNPVFDGMHAAAARIVGSTIAAATAVWDGSAPRALSLAGGMHHAMARRAAGFCVYNDLAVAISSLLADGARRVAYVDLDAHHGDGVERAFWDDDRVLTISVHQHPGTLFPGTGYAQDIGSPAARGMAVNVPLAPRTGGGAWLRVIDAVVEPLLREFEPEILITQHGCDCHGLDPLAELDVSIDAQRSGAMMMADFAERYAEGRWVATGGGGYEVIGVVPRAWTHLAAIVAGRPLDPQTAVPESWRDLVRELADVEGPTTMTDGDDAQFKPWSSGFDPEDAVDRAIMATRNVVFPWHGLDPLDR